MGIILQGSLAIHLHLMINLFYNYQEIQAIYFYLHKFSQKISVAMLVNILNFQTSIVKI